MYFQDTRYYLEDTIVTTLLTVKLSRSYSHMISAALTCLTCTPSVNLY